MSVYDPRKISGMLPASPLEGNEWVEVLQGGLKGGVNRRAQVKDLRGEKGDEGKSAYQLALSKGKFSGTLSEYLDSLHGSDGKKGQQGGRGPEGLSAFEVAVQEGYEGTSSAWVSSLHGEAGLSAYEVAVQEGYGGLRSEWLAELRGDKGEPGATGSRGRQGDVGPDGKSAYQLAKDLEGFDLSLENWLETLHGADGESAYQLARRLGFVGTEREWLESLKGRDGLDGKDGNDGVTGPRGSKGDTGQEGPRGRPGTDGQDGKSAYEIAVAHGFEGTEEDWVRSQRGIEDAPADGYQYLRKDEGWVRFDFTTVGDDTVLDAGVMAGTALSKVVAQTDLNYFEYS